MRWTQLLLLSAPLAIGCGARSAGDPDARGATIDAQAADASPDAPDAPTAPTCGVHAVQGYLTIDPGFGTKTVEVPLELGLARALRDGHGRLVLQVNDAWGINVGVPMTTESLVRLLPDGSIDDSFGDHGVVAIAQPPPPAIDYPIDDMVVDDLGRIYYDGVPEPGDQGTVIVRLTAGGAPDPTWGTGGDGRVRVDGRYTGGNEHWGLVGGSLVIALDDAIRFAENGSIRSRLQPANDYVTAVAGDADTTYLGTGLEERVLAFTADGAPIDTWGDHGSVSIHRGNGRTWGVNGIALGDGGTIDVLGDDDPPSPSGVVRLTATGAIDTSYGDAGLAGLSGSMYGLVHRCDGDDVVAGAGLQLIVFGPHGEPGPSGAHTGTALIYDPSTGEYVLVGGASTEPPSGPLAVSISHLAP